MKYFAKVLNTKVIDVMVTTDEGMDGWVDTTPGTWVETFKDASQRGKYAGIGDTYDKTDDRFLPSKQFDSWIFDEDEYKWVAPTPYPTDGNRYSWDEETTSWTQLDPQ